MKKPSWRQFKREIQEYGYVFSFKKFILSVLLFFIVIIGFGVLYRLDFIFIVCVCLFCVVCLPFLIKAGYKYKYEKNRFSQISLYMEQMCASFNKQSKILESLKDTRALTNGTLKELIVEAIEYIEKGITVSDDLTIYEEAFRPIERAYKCKRLLELHRFLIKIETGGGEFKISLNGLLKDIHAWVERTYVLQREKKAIRFYFAIGILISVMICGTSLLLMKYVDITNNIIYKIITSIFLILCVISFTWMENSLSNSWLDLVKNKNLILSEYRTVVNSSPGKMRKKMLPIYLITFILSLTLLFFKFNLLGFAFLFIFLSLLVFPSLRYKSALNQTILEIKYSFSEWIRNVTVNLQYHTVQMALQESYVDAPIIIKEPLKKLLWEISEDPGGATPYFNFFKEFNLHEVSSAMKMLYSLNQLGADDVSQTLDALMNRNYVLIDKAEKEISENKMVFLKQLVSAPLVFAGLKIIVDMLIFITSFLSEMGDLGNYIS